MSLANPLALLLGLLVVPIAIAYLYRRRTREKLVPSAILYRAIQGRERSFRRLALPRHLLSFLLIACALIALVLAAARPRTGSPRPRTLVVVLDTTSSMNARGDGDPDTRRVRALGELRREIARLGPEDRLALLSAGPEAALLAAPTGDHARVTEIAAALPARGAGGGFADALDLASALCRDPETTSVLVLTDRAAEPPPGLQCAVEVRSVAGRAANMGLTGFSVREADSLGLTEMFVAVQSVVGGPGEALVEISADGVPVDVLSLDVPANGTAERVVSMALPEADAIGARLVVEGGDALPDDDAAWATTISGREARVLLVGASADTYLAEALALHPRVVLDAATPEEAVSRPGPYDLLVLEEPLPDGAGDGGSPVPAAPRVLAVREAAEPFGVRLGREIREPSLIRWDFSHPLFRFVDFTDVHFPSAAPLRAPEGALSLLDLAEGPIAVLSFSGDREVLALGFDPDASDLVLRVAFANLVANVVEWASGGDGEEIGARIGLGERVTLGGPSMRLVPVAGASAPVGYGEIAGEAGAYLLTDAAGMRRGLVAVSLVSGEETDIRPGGRTGTAATPSGVRERAAAFSWWAAVLAALALIAVEWILPAFRRVAR